MEILSTIDINVMSLILLALILYNTGKRAERGNPQHRLFAAMAVTLGFILAVDAVSSVTDGMPGAFAHALNWTLAVLLYLPVPFMPAFYMLYTDYQVFHDRMRLKRLCRILAAYVVLDQAFMLSSIWTGWGFAIDGANRYGHGPYIAFHTFSGYAVLAYTCVFVIKHRKRVDSRHLATLLTFGLPPVLAAAIQGNSPGLSLTWNGMTLSMLLLYMNIQDKHLETDALTGTYNRRRLDSLVEDKIRSSARGKAFSAILIDLDDFKRINDSFGHGTGDDALLDAVGLLKSCLRHGDMISRYGGDEFLILLDIGSPSVLEEAAERIRTCFERFNRGKSKPYRLQFSMGYAVYDMSSGMDPEQFIRHIDTLMYENKRRKAAGGAPPGAETAVAQNSLRL
jgi:diguanylate cyclase (GGDEF)-like protein